MELKKRGFFFTLDVAISLTILIVGFVLVYSILLEEKAKEQPYFLAEDTITYLANTKVADVSNNATVRAMVPVSGYDRTLLEQITYFYILGQQQDAKDFTEIVLQDVSLPQYAVNLTIDNDDVYTFTPTFGATEANATVLISAKRIILLIKPDQTLSGPHTAEVRVWQ